MKPAEIKEQTLLELSALNERKNCIIDLFKSKLVLDGLKIKEFALMHGFIPNHFNMALHYRCPMLPKYDDKIMEYLDDVEIIFKEAIDNYNHWITSLPPAEDEAKILQQINDAETAEEVASFTAKLHSHRYARTLGKGQPDFSGRLRENMINAITENA